MTITARVITCNHYYITEIHDGGEEKIPYISETTRLFQGGVQDADIFPTITARTGDADNDVIMELYGQETDKTPRNEGQRDQGGADA